MRKNRIIIILILLMTFIIIIPAYLNIVQCDGKIDTGLVAKPEASSEFESLGESVLGAIQVLGVGISVSVIVVIGIKYMLGSVEEKAQYKETMKPYIIGVVFLALASTIPNLIYELNLF